MAKPLDQLKRDPAVKEFFALIGKKGGKAKSAAKTRAARKNVRTRWARNKSRSQH